MRAIRTCAVLTVPLALALPAGADVLNANPPPPNNGGSSGWALFFDLTGTNSVTVTHMTTASTASASAQFTVEIFVRDGSGLGGGVGSGPGSSMAGWTSLGTAIARQGVSGSTGVSELIDIPDISVPAGKTVGVAVLFTGAGPRYFGTGTPPYQTFADANLTLTTGDSRSAPFTTGGSFFSSRGLVGSLTYQVSSACYPDCDQNQSLDLFDFLCFTNAFNTGDPYADCDGNAQLDLFDFLCFTNAFNAGCP